MAISKIPSAGFQDNVKFRNIIINGDMSIAQRGTSQASITSSGYYTVDRMNLNNNSLGTWTQSQSTDVPTGQGFATSLKMDCTTADASPAAADALWLEQKFEGQNLQYLKFGTANANSLTLSFWVKSTKTGTFIAGFIHNDNPSAGLISKSYTVDVTDTWEKKTITFPGDTANVFDNDNAFSLSLNFYLSMGSNFTSGTLQTTWANYIAANRAVGQVNIADSTSNDFYITGIQLEAGTTASDFEFLPVDVNLQRCLRYFGSGQIETDYDSSSSASSMYRSYDFKVTMRTAPTMSVKSQWQYYSAGSGSNFTPTFSCNSTEMFEARGTSLTTGRGFLTGGWYADAEL